MSHKFKLTKITMASCLRICLIVYPYFRSSRSHLGLGFLRRNQRHRQKDYDIKYSILGFAIFGIILFMSTSRKNIETILNNKELLKMGEKIHV